MPFEEQKAIFAKLKKRAATAALTDDEREKYNYSLKIARDNLAVMEQARIDGEELGRAEGLAKGLAEGLAKGLTEGRAEGRAEAKAEAEEKRIQEKIANAKAFKKVGVGNSEIASILGLPLEMVEAL